MKTCNYWEPVIESLVNSLVASGLTPILCHDCECKPVFTNLPKKIASVICAADEGVIAVQFANKPLHYLKIILDENPWEVLADWTISDPETDRRIDWAFDDHISKWDNKPVPRCERDDSYKFIRQIS